MLTRVDEVKAMFSSCESLGTLRFILGFLLVLLIVVLAILHFVALAENIEEGDSGYENWIKTVNAVKRAFKITLISFIIVFSLKCFCTGASVLLPTRNEAAVIYIVPKVLNSELVQKDIPEEAREMYKLSKDWLRGMVEKKKDESIKELIGKTLEAGKSYTKEEITKAIMNKVNPPKKGIEESNKIIKQD